MFYKWTRCVRAHDKHKYRLVISLLSILYFHHTKHMYWNRKMHNSGIIYSDGNMFSTGSYTIQHAASETLFPSMLYHEQVVSCIHSLLLACLLPTRNAVNVVTLPCLGKYVSLSLGVQQWSKYQSVLVRFCFDFEKIKVYCQFLVEGLIHFWNCFLENSHIIYSD